MFRLDKFGDSTAVITPQEEYSYGILSEIAKYIGRSLKEGHLIFLLARNNIESLLGYVSAIDNGNPVLPLNADTDEIIIQNLIDLYQPRYIWKPSLLIKNNERVLAVFETYVLVETEFVSNMPLPDRLALLLSTSGSTGSPKLVRLTLTNILENAKSIIRYLNITDKERPVTSLPMYYSFGLSVINSHLLAGATILLTDYSYMQKEFWDFAKENQFTSISGVPYTFEILKKIKFWKMDLPSLKTITQAGGRMSDSLLEYFIKNSEERGIRFFTMYGQTEASARMSYLSPEFGLSKLGSIGKAIPGGSFTICDINGEKLPDKSIGELVYEGPNVSLGYAQSRQDLYLGDENHGILKTGDLGYRDEDGFFYITGRTKRFIKLFGNRISLDYVEEILRPILNEVACTGNDEQLMVFTTDKEIDSNEIINFLSSKLKLLRTVFIVRVIDSIPRSETGKIQYSRLET